MFKEINKFLDALIECKYYYDENVRGLKAIDKG